MRRGARAFTLPTVLCLVSAAVAQDTARVEASRPVATPVYWNQFRGPNGQGVMDACRIPLEFGPDSNVLWKTPVGEGQSSPVIWGDRIFVTSCAPDDRRALTTACLDRASGEVRWRRTARAESEGRYFTMNGPASPTPAVDAGHVYVYFGTYGLICYHHDGALVWERRLDPPASQYGPSVSPILYEDNVILVIDSNDGRSRLLAMDRDTGETAWKTARPLFGAGWATPMIWRTSIGDELVVLGCRRLTSYNARSGRELWWAGGFSTETIGVPVAGDGMLFVSDAANGGREAPKWEAATTWGITLEDYDDDGDGAIQRREMNDGFRIPLRLDLDKEEPGAAYPVGARQVDGWLRNMDADGNGVLGKSDWLEFMSGFAMESNPIVMAILPGAVGDVREGFVEWEIDKWTPEMPSPLYCQGKLYLLRDGGVLTCLEAATGKRLFRGRIGARGQFVASPIATADTLITASKRGVITVIKVGDELEVLATNDFGEEILATPALARNRLYVRTVRHLYAIGE